MRRDHLYQIFPRLFGGVLASVIPLLGLQMLDSPDASADVVVLSGGTAAGIGSLDEIEDYLIANFSNVTEVRKGNFATFAATESQDALNGTGTFAGNGAADFFIIGRTINSPDYSGGVADGYNTLSIPMISFSSYAVRELGNRLGWHDGGASNTASTLGNETLITAAGSSLFGDGPFDWHNSVDDTFNGVGGPNGAAAVPNVGDGTVLATIGNNLLVASWNAGDAPGSPVDASPTGDAAFTFGGQRLLFNLDNDVIGGETNTFASLTDDGRIALNQALISTGFTATAVPEPSSIVLLIGIGSVVGLARRRRGRRHRKLSSAS